jgi:dienelactone hydrolase
MRLMAALRALVGLIAVGMTAAATVAWGGAAPEQVEIPLSEGRLRAVLYRPEGAGPFPAVIGLHTCAGLHNRTGAIATRYRDWAERLSTAGFAVLFPDSYGSRAAGSQCFMRKRTVRPDHEGVSDANAARRWLQTQSWITPERISLLGWSDGAIATLWAVRPRTAANDNTPDFRSAIALYPGCRRLGYTAWSARVPTLILIGGADDWTSSAVCEHMVAGARGRSAGTSIVVYPGAHHDFDHPDRPVHVRQGYAFSVDGSGKIHTGTNAAARADALKRVSEWLAR